MSHPFVTQESSCRDKIKYFTRKLAKKAARSTTRKYRLSTYLCQFCGFFHNGKPYGWRRTARGIAFIQHANNAP